MKSLMMLALLAVSSNIFACVEEAQFSSVVKDVKMLSKNECTIELAIDLQEAGQSYSPSYLCPLHVDEVYDSAIYSQICIYKVGDKISGYLVKKNDRVELDN